MEVIIMNIINLILSNTKNLLGIKVPMEMLIFAGIALGLIIVALIATGIGVNVAKKRKNANNVKAVAPNSQPVNRADDGIYVMNYGANDNSSEDKESTKPTSEQPSEEPSEEQPTAEEFDRKEVVCDKDNEAQTEDEATTNVDSEVESASVVDEKPIPDEQPEESAPVEEQSTDNPDGDILDDEIFLLNEEEVEIEDENISEILQKLSDDQEVIDDENYDTEDLSDDDIDAVFERKARMAMLKKANEEAKKAQPIEVDEYEEVAEELTEESEYEEVAEELVEESEYEYVAEEINEIGDDLINPSVEHTTDQDIVIEGEQPQNEEGESVDIVITDNDIDDDTVVPPPQAISCPNCGAVLSYEHKEHFLYCSECCKRYKVPAKYEEDYVKYAWYIETESYREEQRRLERERIAEEERRKADAEYQEKLRLAKDEKERERIELEEKLRQAQAQQRVDKDNEEERDRQRLEFEQMLKMVEEQNQAHLAQLSEEACKVESIRLATEALLQKFEADRLQREESQIAVPETAEVVDDSDEEEDDDLVISASKYKRSFKSKLIQGSDETKKYYSELRNELLSYNKIRCSSSWAGDTYMVGRKTCAKMTMAGKTLCLYLALNPDEFNPQTFHHKDKSDNRKYLQTPMQMKIKSDLAMRRSITLIVTMMSDNSVNKKAKFTREDYEVSLSYRDDDALLKEGLIKLNLDAIQMIDKTLTDEDFEQDQALQGEQPKNFREVKLVKKSQVGNLSQSDIKKIYKGKTVEPTFTSPNASKTGKFVIDDENGEFKFILYSPTGDSIFESKVYKTKSGARNAIDSFRLALADNTSTQLGYLDGEYVFAIKYSSSYISEFYPSKVAASKALNLIKRTSAAAVIEE